MDKICPLFPQTFALPLSIAKNLNLVVVKAQQQEQNLTRHRAVRELAEWLCLDVKGAGFPVYVV
jgi:hypothetical protein